MQCCCGGTQTHTLVARMTLSNWRFLIDQDLLWNKKKIGWIFHNVWKESDLIIFRLNQWFWSIFQNTDQTLLRTFSHLVRNTCWIYSIFFLQRKDSILMKHWYGFSNFAQFQCVLNAFEIPYFSPSYECHVGKWLMCNSTATLQLDLNGHQFRQA